MEEKMLTKPLDSTDRISILLGPKIACTMVAIFLFTLPAMSAEISADGKGDLLPIAEDGDGVSQESDTECKTDLGVAPTSPSCQSEPKQTVEFRTIVV
jgi:hypothetical protein